MPATPRAPCERFNRSRGRKTASAVVDVVGGHEATIAGEAVGQPASQRGDPAGRPYPMTLARDSPECRDNRPWLLAPAAATQRPPRSVRSACIEQIGWFVRGA